MKIMTKTAFTVGLLVMLMALPAFGASINKSVKVEAGGESSGASSVNGSITVGENAVVTGGVNTVNGSIRVDDGASIEDASTVNGGVRLADNVQADDLSTVNGTVKVGESGTVDGEIETVNGRISIEKGTKIAGSVGNINGEIELSGASVGGDVSTVSGDINIVDGSVVNHGRRGWRHEGRRREHDMGHAVGVAANQGYHQSFGGVNGSRQSSVEAGSMSKCNSGVILVADEGQDTG